MKHPHFIFMQLVVALLAAVLSSCGGGEPLRIGVSQCSDDVWRQKMNNEMRREASFYKGHVELDIRSAGSDSRRQAAQIDSLLQEGIDLLVVSPNEARALTPAVSRAYRQGVPVVVVDRKILSNDYTAFVGADNRAIGREAASYIVRELKGHGTVAEYAGGMGATAAQERHQGFVEELRHSPGIRLLPPMGYDWEGTRADDLVDSLAKAGTVPDVFFAPNDRTGVKIRRAALKRGLDIKVVGIDGLTTPDGGLAEVERGELVATFIYPTGGYATIRTAMDILDKRPYRRINLLHTAVINSATARIYRLQGEQMNDREARIDELDRQIDGFLDKVGMQKVLLGACIAITLLIGAILALSIRAYHTTAKRNAILSEQKKQLEEQKRQLEEQTTQLAAQKQKLEKQRDQLVSLAKELEETTQKKLTFFTEVSHDLRTPLTLILAPLDQLLQADNMTEEQRDLLTTMHANADILLRLVGQTLDLRKFELGRLGLHLENQDLTACFKRWCEPFRQLARRKMVRYTITPPATDKQDGPPHGMIDEAKMESVLYNLLSNAFKYTPEGGKIEATASLLPADNGPNAQPASRQLRITVTDSGKGIDAEKIAHVFDRFYQAEPAHEGSGIGLATVKSYVELHGGSVTAQSSPAHGTVFTATIPCDEPQREEEAATDPQTKSTEPMWHATSRTMPKADTHEIVREAHAAEPNGKPSLLLIDDNPDIRAYMRTLLAKDYQVHEAADGKQGLAQARRLMPDIIVCDVIMPVMDGPECCRRLKGEWQTSHIPVLMLTACAHEEQRMAGFESGADGYIEKPFNPDMLRTRLRGLLANHKRVKSFFADQTTTPATQTAMNDADKNFSERFRNLLAERLNDAELSVDSLAADMGLSRTQLYRKIKTLTGYSPAELLRNARLKRAAMLLRRTDKTVAEVAYETGFSNPGYLTRCFREFFGQSPSDYAKG